MNVSTGRPTEPGDDLVVEELFQDIADESGICICWVTSAATAPAGPAAPAVTAR